MVLATPNTPPCEAAPAGKAWLDFPSRAVWHGRTGVLVVAVGAFISGLTKNSNLQLQMPVWVCAQTTPAHRDSLQRQLLERHRRVPLSSKLCGDSTGAFDEALLLKPSGHRQSRRPRQGTLCVSQVSLHMSSSSRLLFFPPLLCAPIPRGSRRLFCGMRLFSPTHYHFLAWAPGQPAWPVKPKSIST